MANENFYNSGFVGGAMYNPQPIVPKMVNPLTADEREALKTDNSFTLNITPAEAAAAVCTHKDPQKGQFAIVANGDGTCTCSICHRTFSPDMVDEKLVEDATKTMINVLETSKLIGLDLNPELIRGYYQMIPFIEKAPKLYKLCMNAFNRYNAQAPTQQAAGQVPYFNALNMLTNPTVPMGQPQYGYGYGYGYQQPMGMAQPMQQPVTPMMGMQAQTVPGANPFYAQPQQPMMGQPMAAPQQPVAPMPPTYQPAPAAPQAAAPAQEAVVKEQVKL